MTEQFPCPACGDEWPSPAAAHACSIRDAEDDREAGYMPQRDRNLIRSTN